MEYGGYPTDTDSEEEVPKSLSPKQAKMWKQTRTFWFRVFRVLAEFGMNFMILFAVYLVRELPNFAVLTAVQEQTLMLILYIGLTLLFIPLYCWLRKFQAGFISPAPLAISFIHGMIRRRWKKTRSKHDMHWAVFVGMFGAQIAAAWAVAAIIYGFFYPVVGSDYGSPVAPGFFATMSDWRIWCLEMLVISCLYCIQTYYVPCRNYKKNPAMPLACGLGTYLLIMSFFTGSPISLWAWWAPSAIAGISTWTYFGFLMFAHGIAAVIAALLYIVVLHVIKYASTKEIVEKYA